MNNEPIYTESDLVAFGNHLLSSERYESFESNPLPGDKPLPLPDRLSVVHDSDVANFNDRVFSFHRDGGPYYRRPSFRLESPIYRH